MPLPGSAGFTLAPSHSLATSCRLLSLVVAFAFLLSPWLAVPVLAMRPGRVADLRQETVDMFYHGFDNYMKIAFPEDEVRSALLPFSSGARIRSITRELILAFHSCAPFHARP